MAERLIRESDVIKLIDEWLDNYPLPRHVEKGLQSHEELLAYIADAPTIEAKPIIHAHWEEVQCSKNSVKWLHRVSCSNCHNEGHKKYDYCTHCGARMDEVVDHIADIGKKEE